MTTKYGIPIRPLVSSLGLDRECALTCVALLAFTGTIAAASITFVAPGQAYGVSADGTTVVGANAGQAFRWTRSTGVISLGNLPSGQFLESAARGVSSDGSVIAGWGRYTSGSAYY